MNDNHIYCVPGDRLCILDDTNLAGNGTYVCKGYIYSSLCGIVKQESTLKEEENRNEKLVTHEHKNISVIRSLKISSNQVPFVGAVVTCKVITVNSSLVKCHIHCIEDSIIKLPFKATLRKEDIRNHNKEIIETYKCYRPRDIILAKVFGFSELGYMLTTAEDQLGVVIAYSEFRKPMIPISYNEMVCPVTYIKEFRKVAKVLDESDKTL